MQTTLLKEALVKGVSIANRFIPSRPSVPVIGNIYFKSQKGELILKATNLEASIEIHLPAKSGEDWEITAPARVASEFINATAEKEISLEVDKESLVITTSESRGVLAGITTTEFPPLPEIKETEEMEFEQSLLGEAVSSVSFASSNDEGKPILTGILVREAEKELVLVATDGYRLAQKHMKHKPGFGEAIVPAKILSEAVKIAGELEEDLIKVSLNKEENQILISGAKFQISSRLLDGTYPAFSQIIPEKFVTEISVSKEKLLSAVKTTAVFARDLGNVVRLKINKDVQIEANTAQVGEGSTKLECSFSGDSLEVAFNSHFLLDGASSIKADNLELKISGPLSPALIKTKEDDSFIYVVMPVKVQK